MKFSETILSDAPDTLKDLDDSAYFSDWRQDDDRYISRVYWFYRIGDKLIGWCSDPIYADKSSSESERRDFIQKAATVNLRMLKEELKNEVFFTVDAIPSEWRNILIPLAVRSRQQNEG